MQPPYGVEPPPPPVFGAGRNSVAAESLRLGLTFSAYFIYSQNMELSQASSALSALAHEGRLSVFRALVQAGPGGLAAGEVGRRVGIAPTTLSAGLSVLFYAGLVHARRDGRSIVYTAAYGAMSELLGFLMHDCCNGEPQICAPLAALTQDAACCAVEQDADA